MLRYLFIKLLNTIRLRRCDRPACAFGVIHQQHNIRLVLLTSSVLFLAACSGSSNSKVQRDNIKDITYIQEINIKRIWSSSTGSGSKKVNLPLMPALADNLIITADAKGNVTAYQAQNGQRVWRSKVANSITSSVGADSNIVVVGTGDGSVTALSTIDGESLWDTTILSEVWAAPTVMGDMLFIKNAADQLYSLDKQTGAIKWSYSDYIPPLILRDSSSVQYLAEENVLLAGLQNGKLAVLDGNGGLLWDYQIALPSGSTEVERMVDITANPIIVGGTVYVVTYQGELVALSVELGDIVWQRDMSVFTNMTRSGSRLYLTDAEGIVWSFARNNGAVAWRQAALEKRFLTSPVVMGDYLILGDEEGYLHWLSREDGRLMGRERVASSAIVANPIVSGNTVYVQTVSGRLVAYQVN